MATKAGQAQHKDLQVGKNASVRDDSAPNVDDAIHVKGVSS